MRTLSLILIFLVICSTSIAMVNFSATDNGDGTVTIGYVSDADEQPCAIALSITRIEGSALAESARVNPRFNVFNNYALSSWTGYAIADPNRHLFSDPEGPGVTILPASDFSLSISCVDEYGNPVPADSAIADLVTITFSGGPGKFILAEDTLDGGVVGSEGRLDTVMPPPFTATPASECLCNGDANGSNNISVGDLVAIVELLFSCCEYVPTDPPYTLYPVPAGYECYDANQDDKISVADLSYIISFLSPAYAGTTPPYTTSPGDCVPFP